MTSSNRETILEKFSLFEGGTGGLDSWLTNDTSEIVFDTLGNLGESPLTHSRFNQLLTLSHEAPISAQLFDFYWTNVPEHHPYDVTKIPDYDGEFGEVDNIRSLDQLYWGLYRFYVDALLYFGNVRTAYQRLRQLTEDQLQSFFDGHRFKVEDMRRRGDALTPSSIARDNRYLISEMACKSFEAPDVPDGELAKVLIELYKEHSQKGGGQITAKQLLAAAYEDGKFNDRQLQFEISADDFHEETIENEEALIEKITRVAGEFEIARRIALNNTELYLSMVGDLDVYVATSMRSRDDFRGMADFCDIVFNDPRLGDLNLRYFDPTLSAASNHEDKGLIECLMVKCAKILVLQAGIRDSYGKDAEAAMALSLGKPVIIFASEVERSLFFRDVHPLSRLVDFKTGVAIGAIVATSTSQVAELIQRILNNNLEFTLEQPRPKYLVLKEKLTGSVVRLQTSDELIRETFWNNYEHRDAI